LSVKLESVSSSVIDKQKTIPAAASAQQWTLPAEPPAEPPAGTTRPSLGTEPGSRRSIPPCTPRGLPR